MRGKARTLANIGIGLIVFIVTLVVFFVGYGNHPKEIIDWLALTFVLISEIALFSSITVILTRKYTSSQMLLVSGIISALSICWIAATMLSVFSRNIFKDNVRGFATTQIIILAIALIISISLHVAVINVREHDAKLMDSRLMMRQCENLAFSLKSNADFSAYSSLLSKIHEEIKYSDKTKSVEKEQTIYSKMEELEALLSNKESEPKVQDISKMVDEIVLLVKERNLSVLQMNQGGF